MNYNEPWIALGIAVVKDGVRSAEQGEPNDILWLISDDAKFYFDTFDVPRIEVLKKVLIANIQKGKLDGKPMVEGQV